MRNKTFYQLHLFVKITILLGLGIIGFLIWFSFFSDESGWQSYIIGICCIVAILVLLYSLFGNTIKFHYDYLYTRGDFTEKENRLQWKMKICYNEIVDIDCCKSSGNSKGRQTLHPHVSAKFIKFTLKNGKDSLLSIQWYSKRQKIKIIDEIKSRLANVGNSLDLPDTEELIEKLYKIPDFMG